MHQQPDYGEQTYRGHGRLQGRKALITGADSGIGRAVALAFAREGADVLISYLNEHEDAKETARIVREAGRKAVTADGTIEDVRHCEELVDRAFRELGGLDILVNNAAFQATHERIEELNPEEWDKTFKTNISAMFYLCRAALPRMPEGSVILNTASVQAYQPSPTLLAYASTKGAIVTFTKALSGLALKQGIRVNAVAPGPVSTPLIPSTMPEKAVREFGKTNPQERPAQPAELAPMYVFLASDESRYITGGIFDVTGGKMLP
jgi:NAD(P)-dependent dehydrogenase (short-subunit alcohol dehydrogenase family)